MQIAACTSTAAYAVNVQHVCSKSIRLCVCVQRETWCRSRWCTCTSSFDRRPVSAPPRVDSSPNRWAPVKQPHQASIYLRPVTGWNPPQALTHHARIRGQSFSYSTLRTEVILQQATAAQANLTVRPLHLRLPGLEKGGRPWCFLLPASSSSCTLTHLHTQTHVERKRRSRGGGAVVVVCGGESSCCSHSDGKERRGWGGWREKRPTNVPLTDQREINYSAPDAGWLLRPTARPPSCTLLALKTVVQNIPGIWWVSENML